MREAQPVSIFGVPAPVLAAGVVFAAVMMGGATTRLAQGIVLAAIGVLLLVAPPSHGPGRGWMLAALALLAVAATGFLPSRFFPVAPWRADLEAAGIALPTTLSPQPRVTIDAWVLLAAGLVWMSWLMATAWDVRSRTLAARCLTLGITVVAILVLVQWKAGWRMPGWLGDRWPGPFPNRNQTGHVLALGGVLAIGCAADAARHGVLRAAPWLLAGCVVLAALAATYSRGAMLMAFLALAMWNASVAWSRRSWRHFLLGTSALVVAASSVLVFGGPIADRFANISEAGGDFRFRIWQDTIALSASSPWFGTGLGNFAALFPFFQKESITPAAVIHPESDWLWLATEIGWAGVALVLLAFGICVRRALPMARNTQRRLRGAALAVAVAAFLHGLVDVSGHRLGSALAAMLVLAISMRQTAPAAASILAISMWRGIGLALVAVAAWWISMPDDAARADVLLHEGKFEAAAISATRAIDYAPLDWQSYFTRAVAYACLGRVLDAVADFRRARMLEPHYRRIPLEEGRFWVKTQPELALIAWREALRRTPEVPEGNGFSEIHGSAPDDPVFRARLLEIAGDRDALRIDWFLIVPPNEAAPLAEKLAPIAARCDPKRRAAFSQRVEELKKQQQ